MSMIIRPSRPRTVKVDVLSRPSARRRRRTRRSRNRQSDGPAHQALMTYARTLYDPFEYPPVKMGWGNMESTGLATAFKRGTFAINADGTFAIAVLPDVSQLVQVNTSGAAGTTWSASPASNAAALQNNFSAARVVSGGLRVFALFPNTSASGVLFGGSISSISPNQLVTMSIATLTSLPTAELGIGTSGASVRLLPVDPVSFTFQQATLTGFSGNIILPNTVGYIAGQSFPAGTTVWYEAILNLECTAANIVSAIGVDPDDAQPPSALWSNVETFYAAARSLFSSPVVMDGAVLAAGLANPALGRIANHMRSMSRQSGHVSRAVVGNFAHRQALQNSIVIEEMQEDAAR